MALPHGDIALLVQLRATIRSGRLSQHHRDGSVHLYNAQAWPGRYWDLEQRIERYSRFRGVLQG